MKRGARRLFSIIAISLFALLSVLAACTGPAGSPGQPGARGEAGPPGPRGPRGTGAATIVVAAYNAVDKAGADYVAEGKDDQIVINKAIAALPPDGGKIYLSEGDFSVSGPILITKPLMLVGSGAYAGNIRDGNTDGITTIRVASGANTDVIRKEPLNDNASGNHWHVEFRDFAIDGNRADNNSGHGIRLDFLDAFVSNVKVRQMAGNGFDASLDYTKNNIYIRDSMAIRNGGTGFYLKAQGMWLKDVYSGGNNGDGFYLYGGDTWVEGEAESNRMGFHLYGLRHSFLKLWAQGNRDVGIFLDNYVEYNYLVLYARANSLTRPSTQPAEIATYGVRYNTIEAIVEIYGEYPGYERRAFMVGDKFINNRLTLSAKVNEDYVLNTTATKGLVLSGWGVLDLSGSIIDARALYRFETPYEFQVAGQEEKLMEFLAPRR